MLDDSNATRASLILRIGQGDPEAWRQWFGIYLPEIEKWARRFGIRADDVESVVSDVCTKVYLGAKKFVYDKDKGRYRDYLKKIGHNAAADWRTTKSRQPMTNGHSEEFDPISMVADEAAGDSLCEVVIGRERVELFQQAEQQTRNESSELEWQAYHQSDHLNKEPLEIAASLGIKIGNYYTCKSRFIDRLEKNFKELDQ